MYYIKKDGSVGLVTSPVQKYNGDMVYGYDERYISPEEGMFVTAVRSYDENEDTYNDVKGKNLKYKEDANGKTYYILNYSPNTGDSG